MDFAFAVSISEGNYQFDLNAYFDLDGTFMSSMSDVKTCTVASPCLMDTGETLVGGSAIMDMPKQILLDQNHLNLVFSGKVGALKSRINLESRHSYTSYDFQSGSTGNAGDGMLTEMGSFRIAEAYGDYQFSRALQVRLGSFLSPFGLYNQIRYITPLFATVVLPYLYEAPFNYNSAPLYPSNGNVMLYGSGYMTNDIELNYYLYLSAGRRNTNAASMADAGVGRESSNDKALGARLVANLFERYSIGASSFSSPELGKWTIGADINLKLPMSFLLQTEFATDRGNAGTDRLTYYSRVIYEGLQDYRPFVTYDSFKDRLDSLYSFTQNRIGAGSEYKFNDYISLKAEYHYHFWNNVPTATGTSAMGDEMVTNAQKVNHMVRISTIFLL